MTLCDTLQHLKLCPHFYGINALRGELHFSELNGIDRISLVVISPWSNLNLYIMSILETVCLPLLLEIRA